MFGTRYLGSYNDDDMSKQKEIEGNDNIMYKLSPETKNLHRSTNKCTGIKVGNESNAFWGSIYAWCKVGEWRLPQIISLSGKHNI